ncbi:hypothetical protein [Niabella hibiscisoli]|uniref:hypothetical protein n=1 Tax=Niabella hibiscisoli TaxID=1825928 RepID=UPI001F0E1874|nr:hypothetical protein [Niabella hibiscisoli]MCH5721088.1 hypothetical protein [Niabella hibiscisoli]
MALVGEIVRKMIYRNLFLIWILVAGFFNVTYAQTSVVTTASYKGTVGNYPIAMQLRQQRRNDTLSGSYYYLRNGREKVLILMEC